MKLSNIKYYCTSNGDGFRTAVFVSGCSLHCPGCFNKIAWDYNHGFELTDAIIDKIVKSCEPEYINGLSILGGEPMDVKNQAGVNKIINAFRNKFGKNKTIWMWSGYHIGLDMPETNWSEMILKEVDYLIDGPYKEDCASLKLKYRGSSNQRVLCKSDTGEFIEQAV